MGRLPSTVVIECGCLNQYARSAADRMELDVALTVECAEFASSPVVADVHQSAFLIKFFEQMVP